VAITGVKNFQAGAILTAADLNTYNRGVFVFASSAARTSAFSSAGITLTEGWFSYLTDTNSTEYYDGAAWVAVAAANVVSTVASASSIGVTAPGTYLLTGTTSVATITGGTTGMTITVQASGQASGVPVVLTYGAGANAIKLAAGRSLGIYAQVPADTTAGAGESVTLRYDGTAWVEIARDLRKVLTYDIAAASGTISGINVAAGNAMATATSMTFDGVTPVTISLYLYYWATGSTASSAVFANLWDGATALQRIGYLNNGSTAYSQSATLFLQARLTPTAAARAYAIKAFRATSNGDWGSSSTTGTGDNGQGFIRIERDI